MGDWFLLVRTAQSVCGAISNHRLPLAESLSGTHLASTALRSPRRETRSQREAATIPSGSGTLPTTRQHPRFSGGTREPSPHSVSAGMDVGCSPLRPTIQFVGGATPDWKQAHTASPETSIQQNMRGRAVMAAGSSANPTAGSPCGNLATTTSDTTAWICNPNSRRCSWQVVVGSRQE